MKLFDLITQEEIDDLPEDNDLAFMEFVRHCQRRLSEKSEQYDGEDQGDWHGLQDLRHAFMNVVLAAAKRFDVRPFSTREAPYRRGFDADSYNDFNSDLDHYMTQLVLDHSLRARRDSTSLPDASKDRIRSHLHHLRQAINEANLNDAQKTALLRKVDEFEAALNKSRVSLLAVARLTFEILAIPGAVWASYEVTTKLMTNVMQTVAEAKAVEDEQRKLPSEPKPYAIMPPRRDESQSEGGSAPDDEIPF